MELDFDLDVKIKDVYDVIVEMDLKLYNGIFEIMYDGLNFMGFKYKYINESILFFDVIDYRVEGDDDNICMLLEIGD